MRALSARLGVPFVELDALHHLPQWQVRDIEDFRAVVDIALAGQAWVVDGNYHSKLGDRARFHITFASWPNSSMRE